MPTRESPDNEQASPRDARRAWTIGIAVALLGLALTWPFVGAAPPRVIRLATGPEGGAYARAGRFLAARLAQSGIEVELSATVGSHENLERLRDGRADLAFVQGGVDAPAQDGAVAGESSELAGIAGLYYEPLWVFVRGAEPPRQLTELAGLRVEMGQEGSGTRAVSRALLAACGALPEPGSVLGEAPDEAVLALQEGRADALFLVTAPSSPAVLRLFELEQEGAVSAVSLQRNASLARRFRYLQPLELTPGMIDLARGLPARTIEMVAPIAGLVSRADLHPALVPLIIGACEERFRRGELFEREGEFPSARGLDAPLSVAAQRYYRAGRSFLYRLFPFQLAAALDRLKILLLPLVTLLLPLLRVAPPLYRWRVRSRIFRCYQTIMRVEWRLRNAPSPEEFLSAEAELDALEDELRHVSVPLSYAEELYNLRMHARLVRQDVEERLHGSRESGAQG